jgi:HK97 family phage major capsid protein
MKHFQNLGDFAQAIRTASAPSAKADPRLIRNAPTTYSSEGIGEDGGFAVPPEFAGEIFEVVKSESLLGEVDLVETASNSVTLPADQTAPWVNTDGIRVLWKDEAAQMTQSKPELVQKELRLSSLYALVPVSGELAEDAGLLTGYLQSKLAEKIAFRVTESIIRGSGAGQPSGIIDAPGTISVAKDSSTSPIQPADTIRRKNIVDMWDRLNAVSRDRAVWVINPDVESQLAGMPQENATATSSANVYDPSTRTLMGRPIIATEAAAKLGDEGDIILADLSQYLLLVKSGGIKQDFSMDIWFDYDVSAFRFRFRVAGLPWLNAAVTPPYSSVTRSDFVTLAER